MSRGDLLLLIAAHNGRTFIFTENEVRAFVEKHGLGQLLCCEDFLMECLERFIKDGLSVVIVKKRLKAIFGIERLAMILLGRNSRYRV